MQSAPSLVSALFFFLLSTTHRHFSLTSMADTAYLDSASNGLGPTILGSNEGARTQVETWLAKVKSGAAEATDLKVSKSSCRAARTKQRWGAGEVQSVPVWHILTNFDLSAHRQEVALLPRPLAFSPLVSLACHRSLFFPDAPLPLPPCSASQGAGPRAVIADVPGG